MVGQLEAWLEGVKRKIRIVINSTNPNIPIPSLEEEYYTWRHQGWEIRVNAVFGRPDLLVGAGSRAIRCKSWFGLLGGRFQLLKSLQKKAVKYDRIDIPYLIVAGTGMFFPESAALEYALSDQFFDRYRNVSAILYKPFDPHKSVWGLCHRATPWELVHNPQANSPMQLRMFPFATEWIPESGTSNKIEPTCTLNEVLGLPDPWPPRSEKACT